MEIWHEPKLPDTSPQIEDVTRRRIEEALADAAKGDMRAFFVGRDTAIPARWVIDGDTLRVTVGSAVLIFTARGA